MVLPGSRSMVRAHLNGSDLASGEERGRLVRLCARLTGDLDAAEDLAQETLYEAWRNAHKLTDPAGRSQWLGAIARNVCLRWARRRGRELTRRADHAPASSGDHTGTHPALDDAPAAGFDLEVELERHELVRLLDRAMALLPPDTRRVLIERYVHDAPQAETALRLGLSQGAVAMRLQRGKRALRRLLVTEFWRESAGYGLLEEADRTWQETHIWCTLCGARRLLGYFEHKKGLFLLRCPACTEPGHTYERTQDTAMFAGVKGYRPAYQRVLAFVAAYYQRSRRQNPMPCPSCGHPVLVYPGWPLGWHGVTYRCTRCRHGASTGFESIILGLPEGRRFWRDHPRIRRLPPREVNAGGRPAIVSAYESVTGTARLEVVAVRDTVDLIAIHGAPRR